MTRRQWLRTAAAAAPLAGAAQTARKPNIILIVSDDQGYTDLGCFGGRSARTPHLDRLAAEGTRFTDFYVTWPACTPSRGSILTGRHPQRNGLYAMIRNNEVNWKFQFDEAAYATSPEMTLGLDLREVTIGQALKAAGYRTGVVGKWDSGRAKRYLPPQRGFDFFYGFANTGIDYYTHERYGVPSMFRGNQRVKEEGHATDLFKREALRFIDENKGGPFFLYVPFNAPHGASTFEKNSPEVPAKYLDRYKEFGAGRAQTLALIEQMDDAIGEILQKVRDLGLDNDTLVFFHSDNGGTGKEANGPLRGSKAQLFEGGLRVPAIARWPGRIAAGKVNGEMATTLELFPTFLAAAGGAAPAGVKLDGYNLLPALAGKASIGRSAMFWQAGDGRAARVDRWKWVDSPKGGGFFDLSSDLGETRDVSREQPQMLRRVKARWEAWRKEMDASEPRGPFRDY